MTLENFKLMSGFGRASCRQLLNIVAMFVMMLAVMASMRAQAASSQLVKVVKGGEGPRTR